MSPALDPALLELATDAGYRVAAAGDGVEIAENETTYIAPPDGPGDYVLERSSRGSVPAGCDVLTAPTTCCWRYRG